MDLFKCFFFFFLLSSKFFSQLGTPKYQFEWLKDSIDVGPGRNIAKCVSADPEGNVFVCGDYNYVYPHSLFTYGGAFVTKFSPEGNALWSDTMRASINTSVISCNCDNYGNSFVLINTPGRITIGGQDYTGLLNMFLVKYGPTGDVLWVRSRDCTAGQGCAVDSYGNVFVSSHSGNCYPTGNNFTGICKYDRDGNLIFSISLNSNDYNFEITVDASGNIYSFQSIFYGGYTSYLIKYNSSGTEEWRKPLPYGKISADASGICYYIYSASLDTVSTLSKINVDGQILWTDTLAYGTQAIYADNFGSVYTSGSTYYKMVVSKYDREGNLQWTFDKAADIGYNKYGPEGIVSTNTSAFICGEHILEFGDKLAYLMRLKEFKTTSIPENRRGSVMEILPNPSEGAFTLSGVNTGSQDFSVSITNLMGKNVYNKNIKNKGPNFKELLDVHNLPAGVYYLELIYGNFKQGKKVVILDH